MTGIETTKERWNQPEVDRIAGEVALKSPKPDAAKAQTYFERVLEVAHQQQAKSWELRAPDSGREVGASVRVYPNEQGNVIQNCVRKG
jgi:hypothetical protein